MNVRESFVVGDAVGVRRHDRSAGPKLPANRAECLRAWRERREIFGCVTALDNDPLFGPLAQVLWIDGISRWQPSRLLSLVPAPGLC